MPIASSAAELAALRQQLAADPHRPRYHFAPPANWLNDPNGLIEWNGRYHLFYQYNPHGPFHATMHWGHAVSGDFLHWEDLPVALAPTPGGPDAAGCWSGSAVNQGGVPTLLFTGDSPQTVCLATGSPDLVHWTKHPGNPVIAGPPPELAQGTGGDFRDPFVWRRDGEWHMVIGSKVEGQGGSVLRYESLDLIQWNYAGVLLQGDKSQLEPFQSGSVWECPNFVQLGDQHVLIVSPLSNTRQLLYPVYFAGRFDGQRFTPTAQGILVHGASHYAPQMMRLADGRVIVIGWLREERPQAALTAAGWAGAMSLPMTLATSSTGGVHLEPVEELKALRRAHRHWANHNLEPGTPALWPDVQGDGLEVEAVFQPSPEAEFGIGVRCSPGGEEHTWLVYKTRDQALAVEASGIEPAGSAHPVAVALDPDGRLHLHLFLDCSILEVFANQDTCLACRLYPRRPDSLGLTVFSRAESVRLESLDVWTLEP